MSLEIVDTFCLRRIKDNGRNALNEEINILDDICRSGLLVLWIAQPRMIDQAQLDRGLFYVLLNAVK